MNTFRTIYTLASRRNDPVCIVSSFLRSALLILLLVFVARCFFFFVFCFFGHLRLSSTLWATSQSLPEREREEVEDLSLF